MVVGGGNAGLTIATRLAVDPSLTVAVIEAVDFYEIDNGNLSVVPGKAIFFTGSSVKNFLVYEGQSEYVHILTI